MCRARSSNLLRTITILLIICCCCLSAQGKYGGGSGTPEDPYQIWDANDMQAIGADANDWDKCYKLMADIDLSAYSGEEFAIIGCSGYCYSIELPFSGIFDGNDHTISNFTYSSTDKNYVGLFRFVNGEITNLGLINAEVDASTECRAAVGSLVGLNRGTITNCYAEGSNLSVCRIVGGLVGWNEGTITNCDTKEGRVIGDSSVGGLVGWNYGTIIDCNATDNIIESRFVGGGLVGGNFSTIIRCYATNNVTGNEAVGGLVGRNSKSSIITNSYAAGSIIGETSVGGLAGSNWHGTITHCYAAGSVTGQDYAVGGLVGQNDGGIITHCYATGSIAGRAVLGGLVGQNLESGTIINCYATGSVLGQYIVGGLVGLNDYDSEIINCYATGSVWEQQYYIAGGLVGSNSYCYHGRCYHGTIISSYWDTQTSERDTSDGGTGKTTAQMHLQLTFQDWDFINVWDIGENQTYPYLRTVPAGDINKDRIVNFLDLCIVSEQWMKEP